jgi:hypothetical protein
MSEEDYTTPISTKKSKSFQQRSSTNPVSNEIEVKYNTLFKAIQPGSIDEMNELMKASKSSFRGMVSTPRLAVKLKPKKRVAYKIREETGILKGSSDFKELESKR